MESTPWIPLTCAARLYCDAWTAAVVESRMLLVGDMMQLERRRLNPKAVGEKFPLNCRPWRLWPTLAAKQWRPSEAFGRWFYRISMNNSLQCGALYVGQCSVSAITQNDAGSVRSTAYRKVYEQALCEMIRSRKYCAYTNDLRTMFRRNGHGKYCTK